MDKARPAATPASAPSVEMEPVPEEMVSLPPATDTPEQDALWSEVFAEWEAEGTDERAVLKPEDSVSAPVTDADKAAPLEEETAFNLELDFSGWDMDAAFLEALEEAPLPEPQPFCTAHSGPHFSSVLFSWAGSENHDYEDAGDAAPDSGHAAIADGTTLGGMSGIISRGLVRHFVSGEFDLDNPPEIAAWWLETRREWSRARKACYDYLSSVEQQKMDRGGSATFMALRVASPVEAILYWVGDCTCFLIPLEGDAPEVRGATAFDSHPAVIHYFDDHPERVWRREEIPLAPYRFVVFCTDALAKGLLQETPWQNDTLFWQTLRQYSAEEFRQWVREWRDNDRLDADDYTLLLLELPELPTVAGVGATDEESIGDDADD